MKATLSRCRASMLAWRTARVGLGKGQAPCGRRCAGRALPLLAQSPVAAKVARDAWGARGGGCSTAEAETQGWQDLQAQAITFPKTPHRCGVCATHRAQLAWPAWHPWTQAHRVWLTGGFHCPLLSAWGRRPTCSLNTRPLKCSLAGCTALSARVLCSPARRATPLVMHGSRQPADTWHPWTRTCYRSLHSGERRLTQHGQAWPRAAFASAAAAPARAGGAPHPAARRAR